MIGKTIGRYKIVAKLGEGGMGVVWKAEDTVLGRMIALKFLPDALASSDDARRRFLREARAASALEHPGIATAYDAGEVEGRPFIAYKWVDGATVAEKLSGGKLLIEDALQNTISTCEALGYAHGKGILHRDITSRNVMLTHDGNIAIVDFGLALPEEASRLTRTGSTLGTAAYMAPEVITGKTADRRSDLYGVGVLLYEMLTGQLPFKAERAEALHYMAVHKDAKPPIQIRPDIPEGLNAVVMKAIAKDPNSRYQSALEFSQDLEEVRRGSDLPDVQKQIRRSDKTRIRVAKRWLLLAGLSAALLATLLYRNLPTPSESSGMLFTSLAVLPLSRMMPLPDSIDWVTTGICLSLANKLVQLSDLNVTPWPSSRRYADTTMRPADIARELNVQALITGSILLIGEQLTGTLYLLDANGVHVSSYPFSETMENVMIISTNLAKDIAKEIKPKVSRQEQATLARPVAESAAAFELYMKGTELMYEETPDAYVRAKNYFEKALQLDPNMLEAHVGLAGIHMWQYWSGGRGGASNLTTAEAHLETALTLDPASSSARRGLIKLYWSRNESEKALQQGQAFANTGRKDAEALFVQGYAYLLGYLADEAVQMFERSLVIDPVNQGAHWHLVFAYAWAGQYDKCIDAGDLFLARFEEDPQVYYWVGAAYQQVGELDAARVYYERALLLSGDTPSVYFYFTLVSLYEQLGLHQKATELARKEISKLEQSLRAYPDNPMIRDALSRFYAEIGDEDMVMKQYRWFEREEHHVGIFLSGALLRIGRTDLGLKILLETARKGHNVHNLHVNMPLIAGTAGADTIPGYADAFAKLEALHYRLTAEYQQGN